MELLKMHRSSLLNWRLLIICLAAIASPALSFSQETTRIIKIPIVTLGETPRYKSVVEKRLSAKEIEDIEYLVFDLRLENLPPSMLFHALGDKNLFWPSTSASKPGSKRAATNASLYASSETVRKILSLGPLALPMLIEGLSDSTSTGIKYSSEKTRNAIFEPLFFGNPAIPRESGLLGIEPYGYINHEWMDHVFLGHQFDTYEFRVGDLCYVLIGQIVSRDYQCFSFQWGTNVISSPVFERELRSTVTKLWSTDHPSQVLFESLMCDLSTRGIVQNIDFASLDGWQMGNDIQISAAQRLLQYYPNESADDIARRILRLDLSDRTIVTRIANGIDSYAFIDAIRPYPHPAITKSLEHQLGVVQAGEIRKLIESVLKEWGANSIPR